MKLKENWLHALALCGMVVSGSAFAEQLSGTAPSVGAGGHVAMVGLANIASKYTDHSLELNANVPAPINMVELGRRNNDIGYVSFGFGNAMKAQTGPFSELADAPELWGNIRLLFGFPAGYFHVFTYADSGVETYADLKGRSVYAGPVNGSQEAMMKLLAESHAGLIAGEDFELARLDYAGGDQAFRDGNVSLLIKPAPLGGATIDQFGLSRDIRLLGFSEESLQVPSVQEFFSTVGRRLGEIPPGTYSGQVNEEPVKTLAFLLGVGAHKDVSEDAIYDIMSAFLTHFDEFRRASGATFASLEMGQLLDDSNAPLHSGAVRAYREAGIDIPDSLIPPEMQ